MGNTSDVANGAEPAPDDVSALRDHRRRRLVEAYRLLGHFGCSEGTAGHITVRDPEVPDRFWAAPYGMHFNDVTLSDLVLTDVDGTLWHGDRPAHPAAMPFHGIVHEVRPDIMAAVHAHTDYARAMAALGRRVLAISQDACAFADDTGYLDTYGGVVLDRDQGKEIGVALGDHKALLLKNHGIFTVGATVEEAVWWFLALEKVCKVQMIAEAVGVPDEIPEPMRTETAKLVGSAGAAANNARPLFSWISRIQPDMYS